MISLQRNHTFTLCETYATKNARGKFQRERERDTVMITLMIKEDVEECDKGAQCGLNDIY